MSHEQIGSSWWTAHSPDQESSPTRLEALANWCEGLAATDQRLGFDRVLREMAEFDRSEESALKDAASQWITLLSDSGAFESAAVAMIPRDAIFTGGRLKDGSFVAQVILDGGAGAHSREAQSLPMAWLAALLRALARQAAEGLSSRTH
ncbi:hypothetical protein [Novosphingobium sp. B1]|uniref:hypothetical protein n=1 Tax=Novosphingobium sp. B1 TaxID=1938756 RepID=UPI0009D7A672|nr:hypothetical protein [Novosphingobium sp. B1]SMC75874.1 hypothetical protein SAMN06272759_106312 [Novosphingobium sp. B1]